jgi:hypothetical protein
MAIQNNGEGFFVSFVDSEGNKDHEGILLLLEMEY